MQSLSRIGIAIGALLVVASSRLNHSDELAAEDTAVSNLDTAGVDFFEKRIRPVLVKHCFECHSEGASTVGGRLLLDTREGTASGGDYGAGIAPGQPNESWIIKAIRYDDDDLQMPPQEKLPASVIHDFERWVEMGAPDPRQDTMTPKPDSRERVEVEKELEEAEQFWAFQRPRMPLLPVVSDTRWPIDDIDRFVLEKLESERLRPADDASRMTWLRRVYYDLIGLPPSPLEISDFLNDDDPDAYAKVVDHLLESPQFGERWGRHWLDVARFAESSGKEANWTFPHAWRYRNWVIEAFNEDKPYDQFIREQIAGDLLPYDTDEQRADQIVATGFLAIGPKSLNEMNGTQFRMDLVDEQIDVMSQAILGLTVACARCHDHKFDPIPTDDYYALAGIFLSTDTFYGTHQSLGNRRGSDLIAINDPTEPIDADLRLTSFERRRLEATLSRAKARHDDLLSEFAALRRDPESSGTSDRIAARRQFLALRNQIAITEEKLESYDSFGIPEQFAMGVQNARRAVDTFVLVRGEIDKRGEQVPRGFVEVLSDGPAERIDRRTSGRIELADWLTNEENRLTSRVIVNRIWHHLMGSGIVATVDNFGMNGQRPSHPELLDYLAVEFQQEGWSIKRMIRKITLSRTYRMSSDYDATSFAVDPENRWLWRMSKRRLDAECIRDSMLQASGQLDLDPPLASAVATLGDGYVGRTIRESQLTVDRPMRSVYLPVIRDLVPDALGLFDFSEPSLVSGARDATNVPTQALYMMNNEFVAEQSDQLARRVLQQSPDHYSRIENAYLLTLCRRPTRQEVGFATQFFRDYGPSNQHRFLNRDTVRMRAWPGFCQALMCSAEFRYLD